MDSGSFRQVADVAILDRHGKDITSRTEQCPVAVRCNFVICNILAHIDQAAASAVKIIIDEDCDFFRFSIGEIIFIYEATILEYNCIDRRVMET